MQTGEQIRRLRKKQHLTQKSLADKLFVTPQSVSQWERGATVPDADRLPEIADALHTSVNVLTCAAATTSPRWRARLHGKS